ncbi:hypothetical protein [Chitinophaga pinensis]|uniref:Uncharacterized protein n=1 Tax=Chitinophaga pinensis (strain ATCC 43595 / DSM 2588 / LMG 13176 / NBRC 15968 / NCIMB 11800 / UQM 2034) TaxID=485918 RepID=A0A979G1A5_CHIPD|nr:hypothetical protein [Chitinophaga pinensis]ACU58928.1 hypothetical protein Cpin_1431 [Chitinophaga pinensis DSM 2588]
MYYPFFQAFEMMRRICWYAYGITYFEYTNVIVDNDAYTVFLPFAFQNTEGGIFSAGYED